MKRNIHKTFSTLNTATCFSGDISVEPGNASGDGSITLKNVRIVEEGPARGHGVWLDSDFIKKTVELGNAQKTGIKSRFDHQTHCFTTMGWTIGRFKNFQYHESEEGSYATADLHLLKAASTSPHGDLTSYIENLANEAPDLFGCSIEFGMGRDYRKTDKGVKVYTWDNTKEDGTEYNPKEDGKIDEKKTYVEIQALYAGDMVDSPAATSGVFSRVFSAFGLNFGTQRKAVHFKELISALYNMAKFDIGAKTSEGVEIVIKTEQEVITVGDKVETTEEGTPAPDGQHTITESDSGQTGITITVMGGVITAIAVAEAPEPEAEPAPAMEEEGSDELSEKLANAEAAFTALSAEYSKLEAEMKLLSGTVSDLLSRLEKIEKKPVEKTETEPVNYTREHETGLGWIQNPGQYVNSQKHIK